LNVRALFLAASALILSFALSVRTANAFGNLILIDSPPTDEYSLSLGPGVAGFQRFPGAKAMRLVPVPGVDLYFANGAFASTDNGVGWNFSRREDARFGVRFLPVFGRAGKTSRRLGLSDVGTRLGKDAFLTYAPWPFLILQSDLLAGSAARGDGVQAELGVTAGAPVGDRVLVGATVGATRSNGPYARSYFGITPWESARSGLPVYSPGGGWSDVSLRLSGEFQIDDRWRVSGEVVGARLIGSAGRSPVVQSRTQSTFSLTLWYRFK
jgi:outer membrane scaffolding protein for murein synthesis (MipA/OmpV family)